MPESIRDVLAREAEEAEAAATAAEGGSERGGQRARSQASDPSQVYSVRIPVDRLEQLRRMAEVRGVPPTALMRQFVLDRLDREAAPVEVVTFPAERDPDELRLGPSRSAPAADVVPLPRRQGRAL